MPHIPCELYSELKKSQFVGFAKKLYFVVYSFSYNLYLQVAYYVFALNVDLYTLVTDRKISGFLKRFVCHVVVLLPYLGTTL